MNDKCQTCGRKLQLIHLGKGQYECYQCKYNPIGNTQGEDKRIENEKLFSVLKQSADDSASSKRKTILVSHEVLQYAVRGVERSLLLHKRLEKNGHRAKELDKKHRRVEMERRFYKYEYQAVMKEIARLKGNIGEQ